LEEHGSSRSTRSSRLARLARQSRTCRVESSRVEPSGIWALSVSAWPGTIVPSRRLITPGRSRLEATTSFVIIRRARRSTNTSLHRRRPSISGFSCSRLERTAGTRHIVAIVTRLQRLSDDSQALLQEFPHRRIAIN